MLIYRENMRRRYVPMPVQSVLLFLTLMFGPLGYLAFAAIRVARLGTRAFRDEDAAGSERPRPTPPDAPTTILQILRGFREERGVAFTALAALRALAAWHLAPAAAPAGAFERR